MKIAFDALPLMSQKTGIGYYTEHLVGELVNIAPDNDYYLCDVLAGQKLYTMARLKSWPSRVRGDFAGIAGIPFPFKTLSRLLLHARKKITRQTSNVEDCDIFIGTNYRAVFGDSFKTVVVIHDMAYRYFPETIEPASLEYLQQGLPAAAAKAHAILTISEATKRDIIRLLGIPGEKIRVIYLGVGESFRPVTDQARLREVRKRYGLPPAFMFFVGTVQPRKNITGLIDACAALWKRRGVGADCDLVIAGGKGWKSEGLRRHITASGFEHRIHFTGYVDEADLPALYSLASVFVFPSLYEGFGLPVLEAMACGTPVVAANNSSIPEIAGDGAVLVDSRSAEAIAGGIERVLSDHAVRRRCIERGRERVQLFSWEHCARETLDVLREVMDTA